MWLLRIIESASSIRGCEPRLGGESRAMAKHGGRTSTFITRAMEFGGTQNFPPMEATTSQARPWHLRTLWMEVHILQDLS